MRIYLDSSELVHRAQAIQAAVLWRPPVESLNANAYTLASSAISHVEISRTLLRSESPDEAKQLARQTLLDVDSLAPSAVILELAATLPVRFLKSLDAIHVATATLVQADVVLTRDQQMQRACADLGIPTASSTNPAD